MTRNLKRFLAVSLLSLTPAAALAEQHAYGDFDFLSPWEGYVSILPEETLQLPARRLNGGAASLAANTLNTFYIANWSGVNVSRGYYSLVGTPNPLPPNSLPAVTPPALSGYFELIVPAQTSLTQLYSYAYTFPGGSKGCVWRLVVTFANGVCSATIDQPDLGAQSAVCRIDPTLSGIDPSTCQTQVTTIIQ